MLGSRRTAAQPGSRCASHPSLLVVVYVGCYLRRSFFFPQERRRTGFDEFLRLVVSESPTPSRTKKNRPQQQQQQLHLGVIPSRLRCGPLLFDVQRAQVLIRRMPSAPWWCKMCNSSMKKNGHILMDTSRAGAGLARHISQRRFA